MGIPRYAFGLGLLLAATDAARPAFAVAQTAHQQWQLVLSDYALSLVAQFSGKVIRGDAVGRAARQAATEALAPVALQHAGMMLVGRNWRLALPAQALVQKGVMLQRRSMLGLPLFDGFWSSWELDYLWLNLRMDHGRVLLPRLNVATVHESFALRGPTAARYAWGRSLVTGVPTALADRLTGDDAWGVQRVHNVRLNRFVVDGTRDPDHGETVYRHELEHAMQSIRGDALVDVLLHQDAAQTRPLGLLRYNSDIFTYSLTGFQSFMANGNRLLDHDLRFVEWEADAYARASSRPFQLH